MWEKQLFQVSIGRNVRYSNSIFRKPRFIGYIARTFKQILGA